MNRPKTRNIHVQDGRKYPAFGVLYTDEMFAPEVVGLSDRAFRVWVALQLRCNTREGKLGHREWGYTWKELQELSGKSRSTVWRALKDLQKAKLVYSQRKDFYQSYRLLRPISLVPLEVFSSDTPQGCQESVICDPDYSHLTREEVSGGDTAHTSQGTSHDSSCKGVTTSKRFDNETKRRISFLGHEEDSEHRELIIEAVEGTVLQYDYELYLERKYCYFEWVGEYGFSFVFLHEETTAYFQEILAREYLNGWLSAIHEAFGARAKLSVRTFDD